MGRIEESWTGSNNKNGRGLLLVASSPERLTRKRHLDLLERKEILVIRQVTGIEWRSYSPIAFIIPVPRRRYVEISRSGRRVQIFRSANDRGLFRRPPRIGSGIAIIMFMPSKCQNRATQTISHAPPHDHGETRPAKPRNARTLTLDDSDIDLLRVVGALPYNIRNVEALELLLDRSKTAHVVVHVVDTGGNLVHRADVSNKAGLPPPVRDLRWSLTDHFQMVAGGYREDVLKAAGALGGQWSPTQWRVPLGDGVSLTSRAVESCSHGLAPAFCADVSSSRETPENFSLHIPYNTCDYNDCWVSFCFRDDTGNSGVVAKKLRVFFQFLEVVAKKVREAIGLECILGREVFPQDLSFSHGVGVPISRWSHVNIPWKLSFATESAKSMFLDLCDALPRVCRLADSARISKEKNPAEFPGEFRLDEMLAKTAHRSILLQRLSDPVRAAFEKNDHWWMCARTGGFELAAAESEDSEKSRKLEDSDSLMDLIGTAEARPDDENAAPNTIQLRIVEPMV